MLEYAPLPLIMFFLYIATATAIARSMGSIVGAPRRAFLRPMGLAIMVLTVFALIVASGRIAHASPEQTVGCVVIDSSEVYHVDRLDSYLAEGIANIDHEDSDYNYAVEAFSLVADRVDTDDDRDYIAKNNLGCALLATLQDDPISQQPAGSNDVCREVYGLWRGIESTRHTAHARNLAALGKQNAEGCTARIKAAIKIEKLTTPAVSLHVLLPLQERSILDRVDATVRQTGYIVLGKNRVGGSPQYSGVLGLPAEGVYCYKLESLAKQVALPLDSSGALLIDAGNGSPRPDLFRNFSVKSSDILGNPSVHLQDETKGAFAVQMHADYLAPSEQKRVQVSFGAQSVSATLSSDNQQEVVKVALPSSTSPVRYRILVDGVESDKGWIESIDDGDVFDVSVDGESALLERQMCGHDGDLLDLATAVEQLQYLVMDDDGTIVSANNVTDTMRIALRLADPKSQEISAITWNQLCWWGSLGRHFNDVVKKSKDAEDAACDLAVKLARPGSDQYYNYMDSRGLARALTHDIDGAISDFSEAIDSGLQFYSDKSRQERVRWKNQLLQAKGGDMTVEEIFDSNTISFLRTEHLSGN